MQDNFDKNIKSKLLDNIPAYNPDHWQMMSQKLDHNDKGIIAPVASKTKYWFRAAAVALLLLLGSTLYLFNQNNILKQANHTLAEPASNTAIENLDNNSNALNNALNAAEQDLKQAQEIIKKQAQSIQVLSQQSDLHEKQAQRASIALEQAKLEANNQIAALADKVEILNNQLIALNSLTNPNKALETKAIENNTAANNTVIAFAEATPMLPLEPLSASFVSLNNQKLVTIEKANALAYNDDNTESKITPYFPYKIGGYVGFFASNSGNNTVPLGSKIGANVKTTLNQRWDLITGLGLNNYWFLRDPNEKSAIEGILPSNSLTANMADQARFTQNGETIDYYTSRVKSIEVPLHLIYSFSKNKVNSGYFECGISGNYAFQTDTKFHFVYADNNGNTLENSEYGDVYSNTTKQNFSYASIDLSLGKKIGFGIGELDFETFVQVPVLSGSSLELPINFGFKTSLFVN